jgi:LysR family malonate utilization transcriptional regulator
MKDDINQDITFRKLSVFMMFMAKGISPEPLRPCS